MFARLKLNNLPELTSGVKFVSLISLVLVASLRLNHSFVFAQVLTGGQIAKNFEVDDKNIQPGDILSLTTDSKIVRSTGEYDQNIFGVAVQDPAAVLNVQTKTTVPVISQGEAEVRVSAAAGNIEVGDFITSSDQAGVGEKATHEGMVIGKASASYSGEGVGTIPVFINIQYQNRIGAANLKNVLDKITAVTSETLSQPRGLEFFIRYLFAFVVGSASFILGFIFAARALRTSIVAIGRNPLAKGTIFSSMFLNLGAIVFLAVAGLGLSLVIIFY